MTLAGTLAGASAGGFAAGFWGLSSTLALVSGFGGGGGAACKPASVPMLTVMLVKRGW